MAQLIPTSQKFASAGDAKGARRAAKGTSWLSVNAEVVFAARVDSGQKVPQGAAGLFDPVSADLTAPGSQRRLSVDDKFDLAGADLIAHTDPRSARLCRGRVAGWQ